METIDTARLNFSPESLFVLNICLAVVMFGVALGLKVSDFVNIAKAPKPALVGILSQFVMLPALTFVLIWIAKPTASIALGMMMVAACPGGNISNFMSQLAGGNSALSVTLTAFSTVLAIFMTPFNLQFWGSLYEPTDQILRSVHLDIYEVFKTVVLILGIPLIAGMLVHHFFRKISDVLGRILKPLSIAIFVGLVAVAFSNNLDLFVEYIRMIIYLVFFHNLIALSTGWSLGKVFGLAKEDRKTLAIETGIQNSGLGLLLIFSFFDGLGGMAITAGWWGIWHIISGLTVAFAWGGVKSLKRAH